MVYTDKVYISTIIKNARIKSKLTQAQLAEKIDISVQQLSRIEVGAYMPSTPTFLKILEVLDISLDDFGIKTKYKYNEIREALLKTIYSANDFDLYCYSELISALKNIIKHK